MKRKLLPGENVKTLEWTKARVGDHWDASPLFSISSYRAYPSGESGYALYHFRQEASRHKTLSDAMAEGERINQSMFGRIRFDSVVTIVNRFGQRHTGRARIRGPHGWVLNMGGAHGTPAIADERNVVQVRSK